MKLKKLLSVSLSAIMLTTLMACGSADGSSAGGTSAGQTTASGTQTSVAGSSVAGGSAGEARVLKVAAVETAYGAQMWKDVCAAFEAENEGVTVELTIDKKLEDIITPDMKASLYPDIIMRSVGAESGLTETFVKDNNLVDLTDVLSMTVPGESITVGEKILPGFVENSITNPYGDGKTYLLPMFYSPCGLFYDKALLDAKGWSVPETWDEMWALGDKAKAEGIALFTYPTAGYFDAFFYALLRTSMGPDQFAEAMRYGEGIWDTPEARVVFDTIAKLATYTEATTPANANDNDFQKNQQLILDDKAIFMPNGTWVIGEMIDAPRVDGFEWGFTALPALTTGGDKASYTFFEQVWMPAGAENQDLGKQFMAFLYTDKAADIFAASNAIQPIAGMSDKLEGDNKLFYSIYDTGAIAVMDAFAATEPVEGITPRTTFFDPVNSLVNGEKTKEDWVAQIKSDSDELRANLK